MTARMSETAKVLQTPGGLYPQLELARGVAMQPTQIDPTEEWRVIPGFDGAYEASSHGRVWSHLSRRTLTPQLRRDKHLYIILRDNRGYGVHQLVALAFIGTRPKGEVTRHLDGNPVNNKASNIAYGTQAENMEDQRRHGTNYLANKSHCPQGHPYDEANTITTKPGVRRCRTCTNAKSAAKRALRGTGSMPHGLSKYTSEGCRCDVCKEAQRIRSRRNAERRALR